MRTTTLSTLSSLLTVFFVFTACSKDEEKSSNDKQAHTVQNKQLEIFDWSVWISSEESAEGTRVCLQERADGFGESDLTEKYGTAVIEAVTKGTCPQEVGDKILSGKCTLIKVPVFYYGENSDESHSNRKEECDIKGGTYVKSS